MVQTMTGIFILFCKFYKFRFTFVIINIETVEILLFDDTQSIFNKVLILIRIFRSRICIQKNRKIRV